MSYFSIAGGSSSSLPLLSRFQSTGCTQHGVQRPQGMIGFVSLLLLEGACEGECAWLDVCARGEDSSVTLFFVGDVIF